MDRVILVGLGKAEDVNPASLRDFAAMGMDDAMSGRFSTVGVIAPNRNADTARQIALGAQLATYRFNQLQAKPEDAPHPEVESLALLNTDADESVLSAGSHMAAAVNLARTLINEPANICTPERLAALAEDIAQTPGFELKVLNRAEIIERGMGGIQAVSRGAAREPRFIHHLTYTPEGEAQGEIAFVGKGLTFDAGGLSIKPASGMEDMYIDMGGSAAVMGTMFLVSKLLPGIKVHGVVGACENMTGADAYRPSDVITMYSGKTVEVLNTDAEGRLVLADCLHYVSQLGVDCVVDLATLTGACMVALGPNYAGLFSDDEAVAGGLIEAATEAGENLWRMPLIRNWPNPCGAREPTLPTLVGDTVAITAAQFLQNFKGETPWAHIDLAGPILSKKDDGHIRTGGTGFGVLTLWSFLSQRAN